MESASPLSCLTLAICSPCEGRGSKGDGARCCNITGSFVTRFRAKAHLAWSKLGAPSVAFTMDRRIANDLDRSFRPILLTLLCDCHCVTDVTTVAGWASTTAVALSAASATADSVSTASAATLKVRARRVRLVSENRATARNNSAPTTLPGAQLGTEERGHYLMGDAFCATALSSSPSAPSARLFATSAERLANM